MDKQFNIVKFGKSLSLLPLPNLTEQFVIVTIKFEQWSHLQHWSSRFVPILTRTENLLYALQTKTPGGKFVNLAHYCKYMRFK